MSDALNAMLLLHHTVELVVQSASSDALFFRTEQHIRQVQAVILAAENIKMEVTDSVEAWERGVLHYSQSRGGLRVREPKYM